MQCHSCPTRVKPRLEKQTMRSHHGPLSKLPQWPPVPWAKAERNNKRRACPLVDRDMTCFRDRFRRLKSLSEPQLGVALWNCSSGGHGPQPKTQRNGFVMESQLMAQQHRDLNRVMTDPLATGGKPSIRVCVWLLRALLPSPNTRFTTGLSVVSVT
jgi:hypothetical protein